ncbi:MAG TPA: response regulator transcription factor [Polyangiaceae bacterium]|nr:response regulator transcription factor [Polyangiaceae bacterium]
MTFIQDRCPPEDGKSGPSRKPEAPIRRSMARILLIDPDEQARLLVGCALSAAGYELVSETTTGEALASVRRAPPQLVISECGAPGVELEALLQFFSDAGVLTGLPILVLSERASEADRVAAFESGVDDFVAKPFSPRELVLRVRALLRRCGDSAETGATWQHGALCVDVDGHRTWVEGREVQLTATEFQILVTLRTNRGRVMSRERIMAGLWGGARVGSRTIDAHVKRLRTRLGAASSCVETVRGVGYRFVEP